MRRSRALVMLAAAGIAASAAAQSTANAAQAKGSLSLATINGRAIAPVCPKLSQLRSMLEAKQGRWDDANIGCGYVLAGNFERAEVVADSGKYVQVRFTRKDDESTKSWMYEGDKTRVLWTPRDRYKP